MTSDPGSLKGIFTKYRQHSFVFVKPGGNWGDGLIYLGAEALANDVGIRFATISGDDVSAVKPTSDTVIYIHGGGGFNAFNSKKSYDVLRRALELRAGLVVQGPCTVEDSLEMQGDFAKALSDLSCRNLIFLAREKRTFGKMQGVLPKEVKLILDHDTALHLTRDAFLAAAGYTPENFPKNRYELLALRKDRELVEGQGEVDLPGVELDPAYFSQSFQHWLRLHAQASRIVTNRTHSSIAGAILGTPTALFRGAYHKNRSIWEHSLQSKGVEWLELNDLPLRKRQLPFFERLHGWLPHFMQKSWRVSRLIKRLQGVPLG